MNVFNDNGVEYPDSDFLASQDLAVQDYRNDSKKNKIDIVKQMVKNRHNLQYNKHLSSVYLKAKSIFDEMVDEHRVQIQHLEEIHRHLDKILNDNIVKKKSSKKSRGKMTSVNKYSNTGIIQEIVKDKIRIGKLLKKMRAGLNKLIEIDTIVEVTIEKLNSIHDIGFMDDIDAETDSHHDDDDDDDAEFGNIHDDDTSSEDESSDDTSIEEVDDDEDDDEEEGEEESEEEVDDDEDDEASEEEEESEEEDEGDEEEEEEDEDDEDDEASEEEEYKGSEEEDSDSSNDDDESPDDIGRDGNNNRIVLLY
jgi:hypothetical protein